MRKLFFTGLFSLGIMGSGIGQVEIGVKGGANLSWINFDNKETHIEYHGGGFVRALLGEELFLQPELLYSVKGATIPDYFFTTDLDFTLQYLSIPVLLGWQVSDHISLRGGPEINYLTQGRLDVGEVRHQGKDGFSAWDFGLDLGVAFQLATKLGVELRYSHGLVNVVDVMFTDENGQSLGGINEGKNRALQLGIFYTLFPETGEAGL